MNPQAEEDFLSSPSRPAFKASFKQPLLFAGLAATALNELELRLAPGRPEAAAAASND